MKKKLSLTILVIIIFIVTIFYPKNYSFLFLEKIENIAVISGLNNERKQFVFRQKEDITNIINIFSNYRYMRYFSYKLATKRVVLMPDAKDKLGRSISIFDNNIIHYKNKDYIVISKNKTQKTLYEELEEYINQKE